VGGRIAVTEAARNVACTGATPRAITNCLNFGNPKKPEVFFQFREAVTGMGEACRALDTPVTGGNVSLYNENPQGAVYPTPTIGMVGVLEDARHATRMTFSVPGDDIVLLGENTDELGGSEYLAWIHGVVAGAPPACDPAAERRLIDALLQAIRAGHVRSAHDTSEGGLAVALAESCMADRAHPLGASVDLSHWGSLARRALLFGEAQGRVLVSTTDASAVLAIAQERGVPARVIGKVTPAVDGVRIAGRGFELRAPVERLAESYHEALPRAMSRAAAEAVAKDPALAGGTA
jgi:phosphoribosylformylglycinamidine synthase